MHARRWKSWRWREHEKPHSGRGAAAQGREVSAKTTTRARENAVVKRRRAGDSAVLSGSGDLGWLVDPDTYKEIAEKQRAVLLAIADKIERGDSLTEWERSRAAARLRLAAGLIKTTQSKVGRKRTIDGSAAAEFWMLVKDRGFSKNKAYDKLASDFDCSVQAIKDVVRKYGAAWLRAGGWESK